MFIKQTISNLFSDLFGSKITFYQLVKRTDDFPLCLWCHPFYALINRLFP